jgi:glycosyltransferase involved in cell wall biosynthesis
MSSTCDRPFAAPAHVSIPQVAVVLSGWPRASEVFAIHEVAALRAAGMLAGVFATKGETAGVLQPQARHIDTQVQMLPSGTPDQQGLALARALRGRQVSGVHGYFAHAPSHVARVAADWLDARFGFSVHALDARKVTPTQLRDRCRRADLVVCCNEDAAGTVTDAGGSPLLVRHGVDLGRFPPQDAPGDEPVRLLAVGRLVEKKGFGTLLEAMASISETVTLDLVGDGLLRADLEAAVARLGLTGRVSFHPRVTHAELPGYFARSHLVVVPSVVDTRGDRDGLPNVLLEAMASARPVVATSAGALRAGVIHRRTGLVVPPGDPAALASAIGELAADPDLRRTMGYAARARAEAEFALPDRTAQFCEALAVAYG